MDAAKRIVSEIHRRFFAGRRDLWLSGILLALASTVGTLVAIRTLHHFRDCLMLLCLAAVATGMLAGGLRLTLRRLNDAADGNLLVPIRVQCAIACCRFAESNLIVSAGLLATVSIMLSVFGSSWLILTCLAGAIGSVCVLLPGSVPGPSLNALLLCAGRINAESRSFEHWPCALLLFERQRRARLKDAASPRPRLEEFRDAHDAERAGLDPRAIRPPEAGTLAEDLLHRLCTLCWPGGIAALVAALVLLLLAPADWSPPDQRPESPPAQPDAPTAESQQDVRPEDSSAAADSPNDSDSTDSKTGGRSAGRTGNGRDGSQRRDGDRGGAADNGSNPDANAAQSQDGSGSPQEQHGNNSTEGSGKASGNGDAQSDRSANRRDGPRSEHGSNPPTNAQQGRLPKGQPKPARSKPGSQPKSRPSKTKHGDGAGSSIAENRDQDSKPGTRRRASAAPPPPPGQGPTTHLRISGGTQVDGQPVDLPNDAGSGMPPDSDVAAGPYSSAFDRLPADSRPVQIPAFPLRKQ